MVLEHVAQHAGLVVITAAPADRHFLGHRDLHVIDVVAVPDRLENGVGKPQHQHVLHRFLAQVMVDAIHLLLGEHLVHGLVEALPPFGRRVPNGFSITIRRGPWTSSARPQAPSLRRLVRKTAAPWPDSRPALPRRRCLPAR